MKVLVQTPLSPYSGYGNDGIEMLTAMINRGWDVYLIPGSVQAPLPPHIAQLFTKPVQAPFDLYINHTDPMGLVASQEAVRTADVTIGWTMWEATSLKGIMPEKDRRTLTKRIEDFDALVGYSDVDLQAFGPHFKKKPIIIQQGGFDPTKWPVLEDRDWGDEKIRFIQHGVLGPRKDPFRLVKAFAQLSEENEAFAKGATLALHTTTPGLSSKMEEVYTNLRIFYDVWTTEEVRYFYESAHVLVSPARGEGKNLPALEFMSTGGAVIATDFAGHKQWLSPEYAYPLAYTMAPATDKPNSDAMNARADIQDLKRLLLHCFENRAEVQQKGELASQIVRQAHSWDHVLGKLLEKLRAELPAEKGERLWLIDSMTKPLEKPIGLT